MKAAPWNEMDVRRRYIAAVTIDQGKNQAENNGQQNGWRGAIAL